MKRIDLFADYETLPQEVQDVLAKYEDWGESYDECAAMLADMNKIGYTFEYYLTAEPYGLRRMFKVTEEYSLEEIESMCADEGLDTPDYELERRTMIFSKILIVKHKTENKMLKFGLSSIIDGKETYTCIHADFE